MRRYRARLLGQTWTNGPTIDTATIAEARRWAEGYGMLADRCIVTTPSGRVVAEHWRDGSHWYRATN
jgi:hypothetical protein